ncbi:hypothetical protein J7E87_26085 [Streptomyces sp. ISL-1]|uniref:hypothetical protein n=1 Tax=Streptomyces sp. ISL-1 TaxID=2817657 RepID=UPI001BE79E4A|nr:hypothetical protein [Streptomyces sp. ISL-1]MBT2392809.1 hypothetical protein [Streptomyces sp. ISL-1]
MGDADPTPGDPEGVRAGQSAMASTGAEIRRQIQRLKAIGDTEELKGKYVEELKEGADKLRGKLEKTAGRYERVSTKLADWANKLEDAQEETAKALTSAKEAEGAIKSLVGGAAPGTEAAKEAEKELNPSKKEELEQARIKLDNSGKRYNEAVENYGKDAKKIADKIRDIIDDAVEDGLWSWASNLIERNLDSIKVVLEVAGWIATALALVALVIMVVALFMVPGAGWLAAMAIMMKIGTAIAIGTTAAHVAMAATGNGGWGDVAFDVVGLLTMRMGTLAGRGVKKGADSARQASVKAGRQEAKDIKTSPDYKAKMADFERQKAAAPSKRVRDAIQKRQDAYRGSQKPKGVAQELPTPTPKEVLRAGGDREAAANLKFAQNEAAKRAGDPDTVAAAQKASRGGAVAFTAFAGGTVVDWVDKAIAPSDIFKDKPSVEPYGDFKDYAPDWANGHYDNAQ